MKLLPKILIAVVSAAILSLAGLGVASAAIPDSGGVLHGCYKTPVPSHGEALQIIDSEAGGTCASGYSPVNWNQTGPQGPAGPAGPQGPQGATGPAGPSTAGPNGLDVITIREDGDSTGAAVANCPSDHPYAIGGGGVSATSTDWSSPSAAHLVQSRPVGTDGPTHYGAPNPPTGWFVVGDPGAFNAVYVVCAK